MIPKFPNFKKIELTDKKEVVKFTSKFLPYADFNFSNMWSWDIKGEMGLSILNDNPVIKFTDYLNGQPFLSFLGLNMINETIKDLIVFSEKNYKTEGLKLIPEITIGSLDKSKFEVITDTNSREYIYSIPRLATMDVWPQSSLSKGIRRFIKKNPHYEIKQHSIQEVSRDEYMDMFKKWSENKNIKNYFDLNEYKAFERLFKLEDENIKIISLYINGLLVGFDIYETCSTEYILSHFSKTDALRYDNANNVLNWEESKIFNKQKIPYFNWQQDLGIEGLRKSKTKYKPDYFLNKFIVKMYK